MAGDIKCPICGSSTRLRTSKKDGSKFHVCVNYPECKGKVAFDDDWDDERPASKPTHDRTRQRINMEKSSHKKPIIIAVVIVLVIIVAIGAWAGIAHKTSTTCEKYNTAEAVIENHSLHTNYDVVIDGIRVGSISPGQSITQDVSAGIQHPLEFKFSNTNQLSCAEAQINLPQCSSYSYWCDVDQATSTSTLPTPTSTLPTPTSTSTHLITVSYSSTTASQIDSEFGAYYPSTGHVFLIVTMTIQNQGYNSFSLNPFYFPVVVNSIKYDYSSYSYFLDDYLEMVDVLSGGSVTGSLAYEIPEGATTFLMQYGGYGTYNIQWVPQ